MYEVTTKMIFDKCKFKKNTRLIYLYIISQSENDIIYSLDKLFYDLLPLTSTY